MAEVHGVGGWPNSASGGDSGGEVFPVLTWGLRDSHSPSTEVRLAVIHSVIYTQLLHSTIRYGGGETTDWLQPR